MHMPSCNTRISHTSPRFVQISSPKLLKSESKQFWERGQHLKRRQRTNFLRQTSNSNPNPRPAWVPYEFLIKTTNPRIVVRAVRT